LPEQKSSDKINLEAYNPYSALNAFNQEKTGRYHFLFETNVTEKLVGISNNSTAIYKIPWELVREEILDSRRFMVFTGWGISILGHYKQFEGHEISIDAHVILDIASKLMAINPSTFSEHVIKNIIGFESVRFQ
jgi:hypothetical protein